MDRCRTEDERLVIEHYHRNQSSCICNIIVQQSCWDGIAYWTTCSLTGVYLICWEGGKEWIMAYNVKRYEDWSTIPTTTSLHRQCVYSCIKQMSRWYSVHYYRPVLGCCAVVLVLQ
jgi:hypothetical protein